MQLFPLFIFPFCAQESKISIQTLKARLVSVPILTNALFPHFSSHWTVRWSHHIHTHIDRHRHIRTAEEILHYLFSNFISVFSCVSVAQRIPLSLNNLWGACVFLQPETMISALLPHATAHLSSRCLSFPPCLSSLVSAPLHHSQVVSGTSRNRGRLSWSFSLTPGWNGRCEVLNISFFRSDERENIS